MDSDARFDDKDITFRDLLHKLGDYLSELRKKWFLILLIVLPFVAWSIYQVVTTEVEYPANLTFMVNEDEGGNISGVAGILGQFGLSAGRTSKYNLDKILELSKSNQILQRALFVEVEIDGVNNFFINHILNFYNLPEKWAEKIPDYKDFQFTYDSIPEMSDLERRALKSVVKKIKGSEDGSRKPLLISDYSDQTSIMTMQLSTPDPELTVEFLNTIFDALSDYYITKSVEKQETTLRLVESKRDSIYGVLKSAEFQLANERESTRNVWDSRAKLDQIRLQRQVQTLNILYGEALKNVEIADFSLKNATPFIQVIDRPFLPLKDQSPSLVKELLKAILLGLFIGILFVSGRKLVLDTLA